ncbi:SOS response-associated peptidase [Brevibacillus fulvus]|uniref:Abasic site processing protein n=1 Tax=Brevibacillus fulvus TaxID=1125967 RepID=A0A939BSF1_9BACL|nr:SOS response-associated peptidase [Brevibacillus fulvus]MBM7590403.1 putative SOS response-associated peptidase YedK [Brevibacillus fulvus]
MCGRFTLITDSDQLQMRFDLETTPFTLQARYNIAPGQLIPAILEDRGQRRIGQLRWGLVPSWAQDEKIGYKLINARAETVEQKPAFKRLFERKRCIIPADGFYEWKQGEHGKQPMRIMLKSGELFAFAGLFDTWTRPDGQKIHTCTIITTQPNEVVKDIHDRMPVILRKEDEAIWLNREIYDAESLRALLVPYAPEAMRAYPVSAIVGNPQHDQPECIAEAADRV